MTTYDDTGIEAPSQGATLFGTTMLFVALTAGFFTLGAYLGRNLSSGWALLFYLVSFALLIGMRFTVRTGSSASTGLLFGFGLTIGLSVGSTIAYYASVEPAAVWQAAGATALFMVALGTAGYATRRDLSGIYRVALWALFGLIIFGVISIFIQLPGSALAYSILGLAIFAVLVLVDFQRLRTASDVDSAPLLAASIFLDALNVFLFFINIFSNRRGG
jgi:FtsH-binding integral membrane protein